MKETRVSLLVTTALLSLADISARLGPVHSSGSHERGERRLGGKEPFDRSIRRLDSSASSCASVEQHCQSLAALLPTRIFEESEILPGDAKVYLDISVFFSDASCTVNIPLACVAFAASCHAEIEISCYPSDSTKETP